MFELRVSQAPGVSHSVGPRLRHNEGSLHAAEWTHSVKTEKRKDSIWTSLPVEIAFSHTGCITAMGNVFIHTLVQITDDTSLPEVQPS